MKPYSMDLRERVLADSDAGMQTAQVAQKYSVSKSWVRRLKQRRRESGQIAPRCGTGRKPKLDERQRSRLQELVDQQPDATLEELRDKLGAEVCLSTIWLALKTLRLTLKKSTAFC